MHIERLQVFALPFRFRDGPFVTSYGPRPTLENLAVVATTDTGLTGMGEIGRINLRLEAPTSTAFIRDIEPLLTALLGRDPSDAFMLLDTLPPLPAHRTNIPAAIDGLCLDLTAQAAGLPAYALLGGRRQNDVPLYFSIGRDEPDAMAAAAAEAVGRGFRLLQMKTGEDVEADAARIGAVLGALGHGQRLLADANGGYDPAQAKRLIALFDDPRLYWEEPCTLLDDNLSIAGETGARIVLDQCLVDLKAYAKACVSGVVAGCGLKPSLQGGISKARTARDLCIAHDVALKVDDVWAAEPATLASLNLSLGIPQALFLGGIDQWAYFDGNLSGSAGRHPSPLFRHDGRPGLGLPLSVEDLGEPVLDLTL